MDVLLGVGNRADAAVHGDAGEAIGVEPRDLLLGLEKLDHAHRGLIHRFVEIGVAHMGDVIARRLRGRAVQVLLVAGALRAQAMDALLDVHDLGDAAIRDGRHQGFGLGSGDAALLGKEFDRLFLGLRPRLVEVLVHAHGDPGLRGLDAREIERTTFEHLNGDIELLVGRLDRGEVDLAVALAGMRIAGPQQRTRHPHGHIEARSCNKITDVHVPGILAGRHARIAAWVLAGDRERSGERPDRQDDAGQELRRHRIEVEIEVFDLAVLVDVGKLAEHARDVEIRRIGARYDLVERHLEDVAGLGPFDVDRARERVRAAAGEVGAQLLDLLDGRARHHLVVAVHHRLHDDGVAGLHAEHRRLCVVEPAPLSGLQGCRQEMHFLAVRLRGDAQLQIRRPERGVARRGDGRGRRILRSRRGRGGRLRQRSRGGECSCSAECGTQGEPKSCVSHASLHNQALVPS